MPNNHGFRTGRLQGIDPSTRQRIERAVLDIFSRREFHRVSLIEVARGANISLQTIYKYYGSKETLLFSSLDSWMCGLSQRMIACLGDTGDYRERLRRAFAEALEFFQDNPKVAELLLSSVYFNTWRENETFKQSELTRLLLQVLREGQGNGVLDDAVDNTILLDFIYGTIFRSVSMWVVRGREPPLNDQAEPLFTLLWRAIARPVAAYRIIPARA